MDVYFLHIIHDALLLDNLQPTQWCSMSSGKPQGCKNCNTFPYQGQSVELTEGIVHQEAKLKREKCQV